MGIGAINVKNRLFNILKFDGTVKTMFDAFGFTTTKIALVGEFVSLVKTHGPERAGMHAHAATDAVVWLDLDGAGQLIANQCILLWAGVYTGRPPALQTDIGIVKKIFGHNRHLDARLCRVDLPEMVRGTGKFAQPTGCAFFKIHLDKFSHITSLCWLKLNGCIFICIRYYHQDIKNFFDLEIFALRR
jgi:hypothetical protein